MRLAMGVGNQNHYRINEIVRRHFLQPAKTTGLGEHLIDNMINDVLKQISGSIERTRADLPAGFPDALLDSFVDGIQRRAENLSSD